MGYNINMKFAKFFILIAFLSMPAFAIECPTQSDNIQALIAGKAVKNLTPEQAAACKAQKEEEAFYKLREAQARNAQSKQEWADYLNKQGLNANYNAITGIVETKQVSEPPGMRFYNGYIDRHGIINIWSY